MSKPMSEQMQKLAARYEKATGKKFNTKTNAQKIRSMTDEELAELFEELCYGQHGASCQILATLAPAASGGGTEMNFKQFIRWRLVCFVQTHIRHCQECLGSNGHCQECNDWHHLFRRDWQRTYWRRKF